MKYPRICILDGGINKIKPTGLLTVPSPQIWRTRASLLKGQSSRTPHSTLSTPLPLWQSQTSRLLCLHKVLSWDIYFLKCMTQMFSYPGIKLDCTCIAERIFFFFLLPPLRFPSFQTADVIVGVEQPSWSMRQKPSVEGGRSMKKDTWVLNNHEFNTLALHWLCRVLHERKIKFYFV